MNAQQPSNPGIHPRSRTDAKIVQEIDKAKPSLPVGAFSKPLPGGTSIVIDRRGGRGKCAVNHPWKVVVTKDEGSVIVRVSPALIEAVMADIEGINLDVDPAPTLSVSATGTVRMYAEVTASLLATADGYVYSGAVTRAQVLATTGAVPDHNGTDTFRFHFATLTDGRVTAQLRFTSLGIAWENAAEPGEAIPRLYSA